MKKLFSILLALSLFAGASVSSFASGRANVEQEVTTKPVRPSGGSSSGGGGGGGRISATGSVEAEIKGSKDFYIIQAGHKIYWGGGVSINYRLADEDYSLLVAIYDGNKLIYSDMTKVDESVTDFVFSEQTVRLSYVPENVTAKAFLWGSVSGCKPLCDAVEMKNVPDNTYYARGRVVGTPQMGYMNWDEVGIRLEYSDDYFGEKIDVNYDGTYWVETVKVDDPEIFNHVFEVMDFVVTENEDDEIELLSYTPCDVNKTACYSGADLDFMSGSEIAFCTDNGTEKYNLSYNVEVYVNGVQMWSFNDAMEYMYSPAANIKLLDTPMVGAKNADGMIDYVFIDYYQWAVVDEVRSSDDVTTLYFSNFEQNLSSTLAYDSADEELLFTVSDSNGRELGFGDIKAGDVILVKYDVTNGLRYSYFADIIICKSTLTGVVESYDYEHVTINGFDYMHNGMTEIFNIGIENTYVIDIFGRIIAVAPPQPISFFSVGVAEQKYLEMWDVISMPKLIYNEEGFRIEGKFEAYFFGMDTYDIVFNIMNGSDTVYTKTIEADSRMERISIYDSIPVECKETMYMTVEFIHNGKQLYPVYEAEITDGYAHAKGRVISEFYQGICDPDELEIRIEESEDFFGESYSMRREGTFTYVTVKYDIYSFDTVLSAYADMTFKKNEAGEIVLIGYELCNNDIVELKADDCDWYDEYSNTIDFIIDGNTSKVKTYRLSDYVEAYVNGVKFPFETAVNYYIYGNAVGTVQLIDTPMDGASVKDGKYDYIMVDYSNWAVVDYVEDNTICFSDFEYGLSSYVDVSDKYCKYFKNGAPASFNDIKPGNVLNIKYDVSYGEINESEFLEIEISDTVVSGRVTKKVIVDGRNVYTINGKEYEFYMGNLSVGNYYDLYLDSYGRVVGYYEKIDKNYGVIDRVYYDNNLGEAMVRVIKADGTREAYIAKDAEAMETASEIAYGYYGMFDGDLMAMEDRVISYKLNSSNEIHTIMSLNANFAYGEYIAEQMKIAEAEFNTDTDFLNLTEIYGMNSYAVTDIKDATYQDLIDGEKYLVICADMDVAGFYRFAIIVEGSVNEDETEGEEVEIKTEYGVIDRVYYDNNLGEDKVRVIKADGTRESYVTKDSRTAETASEIAYGDRYVKDGNLKAMEDRVISYKLNSSNEIHTITSLNANFADGEYIAEYMKINGAYFNTDTDFLNLTEIYGMNLYSVTDIKDATYQDLIDGEKYLVICADMDAAGFYRFAIIVEGSVNEDEPEGEEVEIKTEYGVIDRVYFDYNFGEDKVRVIKADGTRESYVTKDSRTAETASEIAYGDRYVKDGNLVSMENRVISFKINSSDEIFEITNPSTVFVRDNYNKAENCMGEPDFEYAVKFSPEAKVLNLVNVYNKYTYSESDIKKASLNTFFDGEEYTVIAAGRNNDGTYSFVIIVDGDSLIRIKTGLAVVDSVYTALYEPDESVRYVISLYDGSNDKKELFVDMDAEHNVDRLKRGDVIVYGTEEENVITELNILFDALDANSIYMNSNDAYYFINSLSRISDPKGRVGFYLESGIAKWDYSDADTSNGWARVGFGAIVDKTASTVTIAEIARAEQDIYDGGCFIRRGSYYSDASHQAELELAEDVNVYVYDYSQRNSAGSKRLSYGTSANILKTAIPSALVMQDAEGNNVYDWSTIELEDIFANYAYFKVVDGEITDILVILPRE